MQRFAIILGGGRSSRMGRPKRDLVLDGRSLFARAVDACRARTVIVAVTPELPADLHDERVRRTCEDPPFGGPVAGIAAGLAALPPAEPDDEVLLLACDLATPAEVVATLDAAPLGEDGVCLVEADGTPQYLAARYRLSALTRALGAGLARPLGQGDDVRAGPASRASPGLAADLDTPHEAATAGVQLL